MFINPASRGFRVIPQVFGRKHIEIMAVKIQDEGVDVATRPIINFIGDLVAAADDLTNNRVNVTISTPIETDPVFSAWDKSTGISITKSQVSDFGTYEAPLTFSSPLSRAVNTISIPAAAASVNGYLTSTDWTTFNNKGDASYSFGANNFSGTGNFTTTGTGTFGQIIDNGLTNEQIPYLNSSKQLTGGNLKFDGTNFSIGNIATSWLLAVRGPNKGIIVNDLGTSIDFIGYNGASYNKMIFRSGSAANSLIISTNGNVGIKTETPAEALDVTGNLKVSGTGTFGSTYQAILGDDNLYYAGYFTDGTRTTTLCDGTYSLYGTGEIHIDDRVTAASIVVGNMIGPLAGEIRFDGTHFYGYDGSNWLQLDN